MTRWRVDITLAVAAEAHAATPPAATLQLCNIHGSRE